MRAPVDLYLNDGWSGSPIHKEYVVNFISIYLVRILFVKFSIANKIDFISSIQT